MPYLAWTSDGWDTDDDFYLEKGPGVSVKPARIGFDHLRGALQAQIASGMRAGDVPHFAALSPACREYSDRTPLPSLLGGHGFQSAHYALWWAPRAGRAAFSR